MLRLRGLETEKGSGKDFSRSIFCGSNLSFCSCVLSPTPESSPLVGLSLFGESETNDESGLNLPCISEMANEVIRVSYESEIRESCTLSIILLPAALLSIVIDWS